MKRTKQELEDALRIAESDNEILSMSNADLTSKYNKLRGETELNGRRHEIDFNNVLRKENAIIDIATTLFKNMEFSSAIRALQSAYGNEAIETIHNHYIMYGDD